MEKIIKNIPHEEITTLASLVNAEEGQFQREVR